MSSNMVFEFAEPFLVVGLAKIIRKLTTRLKSSLFNVNSVCFVFFKGLIGNSLCSGKTKNSS